jgi:hypothetical protein
MICGRISERQFLTVAAVPPMTDDAELSAVEPPGCCSIWAIIGFHSGFIEPCLPFKAARVPSRPNVGPRNQT